MKIKNKRELGITLVALVITIIILLILAGVTISTALGQNGLFQRAKYAGEKYKDAEKQEDEIIQQIVDNIDLSQYVINGLIVQYDAIINNGSKKSEKSNILKNLTGNVQYDGKINGATINSNYISFDGTDDYIEIGQIDSSSITIEMTVKVYDVVNGDGSRLLSNTEDGGIAVLMNSNSFACMIGIEDNGTNKYLNTSTERIVNKTINIVVVFNGKQLNLYINNNLKTSVNLENKKYNTPNENSLMILGSEFDSGKVANFYTKMDLYSCRIYNRALSKEEITNNYELDKDRYDI